MGRQSRGQGRGSGKRIAEPIDSEGTLDTSSESECSPESKRIQKAEAAFAGRKVAKLMKGIANEEPTISGENPGLQSSGLGDFLTFVCSKVVNASEMLLLKKKKAVLGGDVRYAEFCAVMATGTIALEPLLCIK
jgi:hypothetical protein